MRHLGGKEIAEVENKWDYVGMTCRKYFFIKISDESKYIRQNFYRNRETCNKTRRRLFTVQMKSQKT